MWESSQLANHYYLLTKDSAPQGE